MSFPVESILRIKKKTKWEYFQNIIKWRVSITSFRCTGLWKHKVENRTRNRINVSRSGARWCKIRSIIILFDCIEEFTFSFFKTYFFNKLQIISGQIRYHLKEKNFLFRSKECVLLFFHITFVIFMLKNTTRSFSEREFFSFKWYLFRLETGAIIGEIGQIASLEKLAFYPPPLLKLRFLSTLVFYALTRKFPNYKIPFFTRYIYVLSYMHVREKFHRCKY